MLDINNTFLVLLLVCVYMHILDDFVLQKATLCDLKQRSWWFKQIGPDLNRSRYSHDYLAALIVHAAQCSIGMLLPMVAFTLWKGIPVDTLYFCLAFVLNTVVHAFTDNLKANEMSINLIEDQMVHAVQIVITVAIFCSRNLI